MIKKFVFSQVNKPAWQVLEGEGKLIGEIRRALERKGSAQEEGGGNRLTQCDH